MQIKEINVSRPVCFNIGQQYSNEVLVIHFKGLPDLPNKYIYVKKDNYEKEVPLVGDLYVVSRPLTTYSGEVKAQIIARDPGSAPIALTPNFKMMITPSNYSGIGEDENYPDDPNIKNYYVKIDEKIQSMDELIALVQSKLDNGEFVGAQGPKGEKGEPGEKGDPGSVTKEFKDLASQIAQNASDAQASATNAQTSASNAQKILDDTKEFANQTKSEMNQIKTDTELLKDEANASAVNAKASEDKAKEYADNLQASTEAISKLKEDIVDCLKGTGIEVNNKTSKPFTDFNDVKTNSVYSVAVKDLLNMPVQAIGVLITIGYKANSNYGCTQWYIVDGDVYVRLLNGTWGAWEKLYNAKNKDSDFVSNFNYMFPNAFDAKVSSAGIFKGRINTVKPSDNFDFDELKESICVYNEDKNANGLPENDFGTMICFVNKGNQTYGAFQVYSTYYTHRTYIRYRTGTWNEWKEIVTKDYFDNKFDAFPFTCFGVIGDSLASGCSNYQNSQGVWKGKDIPKFSWGKYIERKYGVECTLFTKGGTTTRSWLNGEWGKSLLESSEPLEMYYIGLGNNDYYSLGASYLGSASDIHIGNEEQNADTYYGNYSKIIATIKSKSPRAKVFCFTEPNKSKDDVCHSFNEAVRNIAEMYDNVFLFDLEYNEKYMTNGIFKSFEYGSHYVAPGYKLMAEFIYKMTSDYILNNSNDFMDIQWITENHD